MKQKSLLKTLLLLCALIVGGSAWAEDVTTTCTFSSKAWAADNGGTWESGKDGNQFTNGRGIQVPTGASGANGTSGTSFENVSKVVVTYSTNASSGAGSIAIKVGSGTAKSQNVTKTGGTTDRTLEYAFSPVESGKVNIAVTCTTNSIYVKSIAITCSTGGGDTPTTYTVTYDANGGSGTMTDENSPYNAGATVTVLGNGFTYDGYTFDNWNTIADGSGINYDADDTFTISANTTLYAQWTVNTYSITLPTADTYGSYTMDKTNPVAYGTKVTLTYTPATGYENYQATWSVNGEAISGNTFTMPDEAVTVTVSVAEVVDYVILPFNWAGGPKNDLTAVTGVTASGLGSDYGDNNAPYYVKFDGNGDYIQFKTDRQPDKVTIGVKMIGGASTSKITVQGSADGNTFTDVEELTISGAQNDELTLETSNDFAATDRYVKLYFTKGSNVGVGPISITKATTDPVINAENVEIEYNATSGEIAYTITNPTSATLGATTTADWISNIAVTADKVTFTTTANEGSSDRIATITLAYTGATSRNVTVTQKHFVIDFAELPFNYDENGSGTLPVGFTNNGVGTYASSPKMKFDAEGDFIELKLNKAPGTISFDIKGNGSGSYPQSGVFKVQVSANGDDYSDIASYSSLGDTETITLYNTNASVRYIKWIYVTKTVGNVALGNIKVIAGFQKAVTEVGWATWNAPCAVSFPEGVSAYLVTVNSDPTKVSLIEVSDVPANTPVLLEASAGTYEMRRVESSATSTEGNLLRVSTGTNIANAMYVLATIEGVVGFYMWDKTKGGDLPEGKIYLEMPSGARPFIALPGEETGISDMNRETITNNRYFDLQGRRVAQPTKGMYIVNGKKVVVK